MQEPTSPAAPETIPPDLSALEEPVVNRGALMVVFLVVFIDLLGFGIVLPLLPLFGRRYIEGLLPGPENQPLVGMTLGLLMASFSAMQFLFAPMWGRLSDRVGRRPILLVGLAGSVIFYALFGFASDLPANVAGLALTLLFLTRMGAGIAGATIPTAQAAIADSTPPEKRKIGMALIGAAFGIGFALGPLIGFGCLSLFPDYLGSLGYAAAGLSLLALLLGFRLLPETRKFGRESQHRRWFSWKATREVLQMPTVGLLVLIFFLTTMGFGSFEPTLALLCRDILGLEQESQIFLIFAFVGFILLFTQGYLYRRLAPRFSEIAFITAGISLMGLGLLALGAYVYLAQDVLPLAWGVSLAWMLLSLTLSVVGFAFLTPSIQALISRRSDPERQGEVLGVNQSFSALARILGPFLGMTLYHIHSSHLLPYVFGGVILLAMLPLVPRIQKG
jgi:MFS transporter, DHA1 family, tetracycline resistance protein